MAVEKSTQFASVCWQIGDIQTLRPEWSDERCADFLRSNQRQIQDDMVERGWSSIETLLDNWEEDDDD